VVERIDHQALKGICLNSEIADKLLSCHLQLDRFPACHFSSLSLPKRPVTSVEPSPLSRHSRVVETWLGRHNLDHQRLFQQETDTDGVLAIQTKT
jgi:hypothetical protein